MRRLSALAAVVLTVVLGSSSAAWACGSLVAPNGAVALLRTTTLVAYHDGVEHYVTNFEFASPETSFGSVIPLPAEPTEVERAGDWTLQRLEQEVAPPAPEVLAAEDAARAPAGRVDVLRQTRIGSLDVTILRGGGADVARWAAEQGFAFRDDGPRVLEFYSRRSPYFMAAKFDAAAAVADGFDDGDGIPVHLTIPVDHPWVPLHILATDKFEEEVVQADVFLLTDEAPSLLAGPGLTLERSEPAGDDLLGDLRSDERSEWVPDAGWLSFLKLEAPAGDLTYDLAVDVEGDRPEVADTGLDDATGLVALGPAKLPAPDDDGWPWQGTVVLGAAALFLAATAWVVLRPPAAMTR